MKLETPALTTRCAAAVKRPLPHTGLLGGVRRCGRGGPARTADGVVRTSAAAHRVVPAAVGSTVCVLGVVRRCGRVGSGSVRRRRVPHFSADPSGRLRQRSTARCASSASSVAAGGLVPALSAVGDVRTSAAAHRVVSGSGRQHGVRPRRRPSLREGCFRLCAPAAMSVLPQRPIGSSRQRSTAWCASSASSVAAGGLFPALCAVGDVRTSAAAHRVVPAAVHSTVCVTKGASLRPPTPEPHSTGGEPPPPLSTAAPPRATRPGGAGAGDPLDTPGSGPSANSRRGEFPGRDT